MAHLNMIDSGGGSPRRTTPRRGTLQAGLANIANTRRNIANTTNRVNRAVTRATNSVNSYTPPASVSTRTAPRAQTYSAPSGFSSGGGYVGGGGGGGMALQSVPEPPQPKKWDDLTEEEQTDYLAGDATYTAQEAALEQELKNLMAELAMQRTNYNTDYDSALTNLGWNTETESFDPTNMLGAYGMAFNNQQNDFAGRGMLDSSAYANALTDLGTSFDRQRGDLSNARSNFLRELETRQEGAERTNVQDLQRARADAIARRAAREGII